MPSAHTFSGVQVLQVVTVAARWGIKAEALLAGLDLSERELSEPGTRVSVTTAVELIERARRSTGEPAFGVHLGLSTQAPAYGYLGFAALAAKTLRDALELAVRFSETVTTAVGLHLRVGDREAELIVDERADFGPARDAILLATLVGIWKVAATMTGVSLSSRIDLALPDPGYRAQVAEELPLISFGQPLHRLAFDARQVDLPYLMHDPVATRLGADLCQRELVLQGLDDRIAGKVRQLIASGCFALDRAADALHVSPRTLKRRLAKEGVTFKALLEQERREQALLLLRSARLSLSEIADRLGYANLGTFERAFRRWTSQAPSAYRQKLRLTEA